MIQNKTQNQHQRKNNNNGNNNNKNKNKKRKKSNTNPEQQQQEKGTEVVVTKTTIHEKNIDKKEQSSQDLSNSKATTMTTTAITTTTTTTTTTSAIEKCQLARQLWLSATSIDDLNQVETLYRMALNAKQQTNDHSKHNKRQKTNHNNNKSKQPHQMVQYAELSPKEYRSAAERLSLLYCQSGRTEKAKPGLEYLGFTCRLAKQVLDYPMPKYSNNKNNNKNHHKGKKQGNNNNNKASSSAPSSPYCAIYNHFLQPQELQFLQSILLDPNASYWKDHHYQVEPPSPYFSYVIPLKDVLHQKSKQQQHHTANSSSNSSLYGPLGRIISKIATMPQLHSKFPTLKHAKFVELWAHNRPHASGHQLHFDSDDEGRGERVKNPIISTILYLTDNNQNNQNDNNDGNNKNHRNHHHHHHRHHDFVGGPSLVTNQTLASTHLATQGWLAYPQPGRLVAFDGSVLHGVIPGKGVVDVSNDVTSSNDNHNNDNNYRHRRVTLMLAFWKHIEIRTDPKGQPGSARPFPIVVPTNKRQQQTGDKNNKKMSKNKTNKNDDSRSSTEEDENNVEWKDSRPEWARAFTTLSSKVSSNSVDTKSSTVLTKPLVLEEDFPIPLKTVYETLDGKPWTIHDGMPDYETVFQGF